MTATDAKTNIQVFGRQLVGLLSNIIAKMYSIWNPFILYDVIERIDLYEIFYCLGYINLTPNTITA